ncbi:MAG: hypothetical protein HQ559_16585 [Lentisphaerae bacterium]|nr:hypothetical protein [Lentisphaerota bacterium]
MDSRQIVDDVFSDDPTSRASAHEARTHMEFFHPREYAYLDDQNNPPVVNLLVSEREDFLKQLAQMWDSVEPQTRIMVKNMAQEMAKNKTKKKTRKRPTDPLQKQIGKVMRATAQNLTPKRKRALRHPDFHGQVLGRSIGRDSLQRLVSGFLCHDHKNKHLDDDADVPALARAFVDSILDVQSLEEQLKLLRDMPLCQSGRIMFAWFSLTRESDPFCETDSGDELLRRLGLKKPKTTTPDKQQITWAHVLPDDTEPRCPTVLDAALHPQWVRGGYTLPTDVSRDPEDGKGGVSLDNEACQAKTLGGLPEVVHGPVPAKNLKKRICLVEDLYELAGQE